MRAVLAAAVQSLGRALFNIQITMVECSYLQDNFYSEHINNIISIIRSNNFSAGPSCGVGTSMRSRRQFFLDHSALHHHITDKDRRRIARNKKTKKSLHRSPAYWKRQHKSESQLRLV